MESSFPMQATEITEVDFGTCHLPGNEQNAPTAVIPEKDSRTIDKSLILTDKSGRKTTTFALFNDRFLSIEKASKRSSGKETVIDLAYLDDRTSETRQRSTGMFVVASLCFVAAIVCYSILSAPFLVTATAFVLAVVFSVFGLESQKHIVRFHTMIGTVPVLEFSLDNSSNGNADSFVRDIKQGIAGARKSLPDGNKLTPVLVAEMRRLTQAGLISSEQYDSLKNEIFASRRRQARRDLAA